MSRSTRRITVVAAVVVAAALLAPAAGAQDPAPAEPDLAAMAIGVQDLPRGAKVISEGATTTPGAAAGYERMFGLSGHAARAAGFLSLDSTVSLYDDVPTASSWFSTFRETFSARRGRRGLARSLAAAFDVPLRRIKVGRVRDAHVGDEAFGFPVKIRAAGMTIREVLAFTRVDSAVAHVVTGGLGPAVRLKHRTFAMLATSVEHIRTDLPPARG